MVVGDQDMGNVAVIDGATLDVNTLTVGNGEAGNGELDILTGGTVTSQGDATVAAEEGSQGDIDIDGDESSLTVHGGLTVGEDGTGSLTVENAGTLSTGDTTIGDQENSTGIATVTDGDSSWTAAGLTVGGSGTGKLNIENGETVNVNSPLLSIGDQPTGTGTITISGDDSTLNFYGKLEIGEQGEGLFALQAGTSFTATSVVVGDMPKSSGTLNITGTNTDMDVITDFNIGEQGTGVLNVTNGAKLTSDLNTTLADMSKSSATATVDTLGSWSIGGTLTVGGQSTAMLTVSGGGNVSAANVTIGDQSGSSSMVTVTGVSASGAPPKPSTLQFSGILTVANGTFGELDITQGAKVMTFGDSQPGSDILPDGNGGYTVVGTPIRAIEIAGQEGIAGIVNVTGAGSGITADLINAGVNGAGSMTVSGGASGTANLATVVGNKANSNGTLDIFGNGLATGNTSYQAGAASWRFRDRQHDRERWGRGVRHDA